MQPERVEPATLYEKDFALWSKAQAAAVRERRWPDVDVDHVVEELEGLGLSQRSEIRNRLRVLMQHRLKQEVQPERASRSWHSTIVEQASSIAELLDESPSLRRELPGMIHSVFPRACKVAAAETGLSLGEFPEEPTAAFEAEVLALISEL